MDAPLFEKAEKIEYKNWAKKFDELHLENYDTIVTHSLGGRATMNFIIENHISLDRLIMVSPGMESTSKEVQGFYDTLKADVTELKKYVSEIVVLAS